jgi:uncharacterized protein YndB with AHSA1/START domain
MWVFVFLAALLATPCAFAQSYDAPPVVNARRVDGGGQATASMDVNAPPAAVWAVLTDCANARRFMRELISCRIIERGEGWEVREHRVRGWVLRPVLRSVARIDLTPNQRFAFRRIGGDWERSDGEWRLTPIDGGRGTRVEYTIDAAMRGPIPVPQARLIRTVRNTLSNLRHEAEVHAAAS